MNDPTTWNTAAFDVGLGTFTDNAMAKEVAKRCNAYPGLVAFVKKACDTSVTRPEALAILRALGEESAE